MSETSNRQKEITVKSNLTAHVSTARALAENDPAKCTHVPAARDKRGRLSSMAVFALIMIVALPLSPRVAAQQSSVPMITSVIADYAVSPPTLTINGTNLGSPGTTMVMLNQSGNLTLKSATSTQVVTDLPTNPAVAPG